MEVIDKGPVWICIKCHCMLKGTPTEEDEDSETHPQTIDYGFHCPLCEAWNVCRTEIHPYVLERQKIKEEQYKNDVAAWREFEQQIKEQELKWNHEKKFFNK